MWCPSTQLSLVIFIRRTIGRLLLITGKRKKKGEGKGEKKVKMY
jgi:hypothetical protein